MEEEIPVAKPYTVGNELKQLVNNRNLSDILFLVGDEKKMINGHKNILSLGSPVFKSMFFGGLKEEQEQITIPDLSPIGFMNMIKYIYGHKVEEFDLNEIYVTYVAGDKYLCHHLNDTMIEYVNKILSEKNCFIMYEQLIGIPNEEQTLNRIINYIRTNTKAAFEDDHFAQMSNDTLVDVLTMESLNIDEIDVLKAVSNWIDAEVVRQDLKPTHENKQNIFEFIKSLIRFTKLTIEEMISFDNFDDLLKTEEIGGLFLHLKNKKYPIIDCKTKRKKLFSITNECNQSHHLGFFQFRLFLNVNEKVYLKRLYTTIPEDVTSLSLSIEENNDLLQLDLDPVCESNRWVIEFKNPVQLNPNCSYLVIFRFNNYVFNYLNGLSDKREFKIIHKDESYIFTLTFDEFHCIKTIDFYDSL